MKNAVAFVLLALLGCQPEIDMDRELPRIKRDKKPDFSEVYKPFTDTLIIKDTVFITLDDTLFVSNTDTIYITQIDTVIQIETIYEDRVDTIYQEVEVIIEVPVEVSEDPWNTPVGTVLREVGSINGPEIQFSDFPRYIVLADETGRGIDYDHGSDVSNPKGIRWTFEGNVLTLSEELSDRVEVYEVSRLSRSEMQEITGFDNYPNGGLILKFQTNGSRSLYRIQ